jgi:hypothetical protein
MAFPYTKQMCLFVSNSEQGALGQFMRDFGDDLEGFVVGDEADMVAVSTDGNGPPDGWIFASWTTPAQADAWENHPELPPSTVVDSWDVGASNPNAWLAGLVPPMQIITEEV